MSSLKVDNITGTGNAGFTGSVKSEGGNTTTDLQQGLAKLWAAYDQRGDVLGYSFITFLAPGLIIQSMILQSFSHSVSSLMISKMQGNIVDILYAPLSAFEVSFAIIIVDGSSAGVIVRST